MHFHYRGNVCFFFPFSFFWGGGGGGNVGGKNYLFNTVRLFIVLFFIVCLFVFFSKPEDSFSPVYLFGQPLYWKQQGKPLAISWISLYFCKIGKKLRSLFPSLIYHDDIFLQPLAESFHHLLYNLTGFCDGVFVCISVFD